MGLLCCRAAQPCNLSVVSRGELNPHSGLEGADPVFKFTLLPVGFMDLGRQKCTARLFCNPVALPSLHWWLDLQAGRNHSFVLASHVQDVHLTLLCKLLLCS